MVFAEDKLTLLKEFHRRVMDKIGGIERTTDESAEKGLAEAAVGEKEDAAIEEVELLEDIFEEMPEEIPEEISEEGIEDNAEDGSEEGTV
jgi:hypothetical protein